ncbi:hypothetical protein Tco_0543119 [Tanacetum coccineum]
MIQENTKKQKVEDDKETAELKQLMKIILDGEEVAIDVILLAVKSPSIVSWKIYIEERKSYYQIIRADGKSQMYMFFSQMLKNFNKEDLEDLYKLVKAKYESTKLVEDLDLLLLGDLKTMFKPHGRIVGIKSLLDAVRIIAAQVYVNIALMKLMLLMNFKENILSSYYCWHGYIKIHKKTVKNGQARTQERKSEQKPEAKARKIKTWRQIQVTIHPSSPLVTQGKSRGFSQLKGTEDNSRARLQDGRERLVKSSFSLTHSQAKATWLWKKAQGELGFTLGSLREVTQGSHQGLPAWQSV